MCAPITEEIKAITALRNWPTQQFIEQEPTLISPSPPRREQEKLHCPEIPTKFHFDPALLDRDITPHFARFLDQPGMPKSINEYLRCVQERSETSHCAANTSFEEFQYNLAYTYFSDVPRHFGGYAEAADRRFGIMTRVLYGTCDLNLRCTDGLFANILVKRDRDLPRQLFEYMLWLIEQNGIIFADAEMQVTRYECDNPCQASLRHHYVVEDVFQKVRLLPSSPADPQIYAFFCTAQAQRYPGGRYVMLTSHENSVVFQRDDAHGRINVSAIVTREGPMSRIHPCNKFVGLVLGLLSLPAEQLAVQSPDAPERDSKEYEALYRDPALSWKEAYASRILPIPEDRATITVYDVGKRLDRWLTSVPRLALRPHLLGLFRSPIRQRHDLSQAHTPAHSQDAGFALLWSGRRLGVVSITWP